MTCERAHEHHMTSDTLDDARAYVRVIVEELSCLSLGKHCETDFLDDSWGVFRAEVDDFGNPFHVLLSGLHSALSGRRDYVNMSSERIDQLARVIHAKARSTLRPY